MSSSATQTYSEVAVLLQTAVALHQRGRLVEAEQSYRKILAIDESNFDALQLLGAVKIQHEHYLEGAELITRALSINPTSPRALLNLGFAVLKLDRPTDAVNRFQAALAVNPRYVQALYGLGLAYSRLGRYEDAIANFERALYLQPNNFEALNHYGLALHKLDRHLEAIAAFDRALAVKSDDVGVMYSRGAVLAALNRLSEALKSFDQALAINPNCVEALNNRAVALQKLGRLEEGLACIERALLLDPRHVAAIVNRGLILANLNRYADAIAAYDHALGIDSSFVEAVCNRGNALSKIRMYDDAMENFEQALARKPDLPEAWLGRANVFKELKRYDECLAACDKALALKPNLTEAWACRGAVFLELNRYREAVLAYDQVIAFNPDRAEAQGLKLSAKMHLCDWYDFERDCSRLLSAIDNGICVAPPFALFAIPSTPAQQLKSAELFVQRNCRAATEPLWRGERYSHDRIRVCYLSADFHDHATAALTAGLFENHDRSRFETIAFSFGSRQQGTMRQRLMRAFDRFIDVRAQSDEGIAELIRRLEIDIAIALNGFTEDHRTNVFAKRAAPIQVNFLGYPGTMGARYIDYMIADRIVVPPDQQTFYSEKIIYMPDTYQANDNKREVPDIVLSRRQERLPSGGFVFCSFNNSYKITPAIFDIWMRLLRQVDESVLWLLEGNSAMRDNLCREAQARGIAPDRMIFAPRVSFKHHLARHQLADLFLDTLPCNAHTTASDALWAELPVLTCLGSTFAARVAGSLLMAVGLPELITHSLAEYETVALRLARNSAQIQALRRKLAQNRVNYPLFDTARFARHIEAAYTTIWERHQGGKEPVGFSVEPSQPSFGY